MADTSMASADQSQLLRLNIDFLRLLVRSHRETDADPALRQQLNLSAKHAEALALCDAAGLQRMATCGFSLYSLALHRADLWQRAVAYIDIHRGPSYGITTDAPDGDELTRIRRGFMECALFFAWHLAQQQPRHARLSLGMSEDVTAIVGRLELWQCRHIAQTDTKLLGPRWRHHAFFWTDLLRYGGDGNPQDFKFACLLGSQLMAQDLEPSAILHLSSRGAT